MFVSQDRELQTLRNRVKTLEAQIRALGHEPQTINGETTDTETASSTHPVTKTHPLELEEYVRYGRQMILPGFGLPCKLDYSA